MLNPTWLKSRSLPTWVNSHML